MGRKKGGMSGGGGVRSVSWNLGSAKGMDPFGFWLSAVGGLIWKGNATTEEKVVVPCSQRRIWRGGFPRGKARYVRSGELCRSVR